MTFVILGRNNVIKIYDAISSSWYSSSADIELTRDTGAL